MKSPTVLITIDDHNRLYTLYQTKLREKIKIGGSYSSVASIILNSLWVNLKKVCIRGYLQKASLQEILVIIYFVKYHSEIVFRCVRNKIKYTMPFLAVFMVSIEGHPETWILLKVWKTCQFRWIFTVSNIYR